VTIVTRNNWWLGVSSALAFLAHSPNTLGHEVVTGWEGSSSRGYAFVSPVFTAYHSEPISWLVRGSVNYLYYDFPEGAGKTKVRSPGESLGVAFRYSAPGITATIGPGYETRQTRRHLPSGAETKETEHGLLIQGDVFYHATPLTTLSLLGSYSGANDYVWVRAGAKRQMSNFKHEGSTTLHVGAELTGQGNQDSKSVQIGPVVEFAYPRVNASLQFRAGLERVEAGDSRYSRGYFGVGFYKGF
jgi:hypothetical protein